MIVRIVMLALFPTTALAGDPPPIVITGDEQKQLDLTRPDGGLRAYGGVANIQVHRAEPGWTYNHHVDMACWKGRLYLAWDSTEKDEDVGVSRELYASSSDGVAWSAPRGLFQKGLSSHARWLLCPYLYMRLIV